MKRPPASELLRCAPALSPALAREWLDSARVWFGPARVPLPRALHKENLALIQTPLGPVVAKREVALGWRRPLVAVRARPLRSLRAYEIAVDLRARGHATPEPLAVLVRAGMRTLEAVLVTRFVEGVGPWEYLRNGGSPEELRDALAASLARLHACGFRHRDLKAANLLLRAGEERSLELVWTDLDGMRRIGSVPPFLRARDLARLSMSFESAEARAAGVRADHWPALLEAHLTRALGREPRPEELSFYRIRTRRWAERSLRRHMARGRAVV